MWINGILPPPSLANGRSDIFLKSLQLRMPFHDMLPAFISQRNPIAPTIRNLFQ